MKITRTGVMLAAAMAVNVVAIGTASAQVSPAEAAKLGKELTCVGAEQAGNAAGTIPAYTGKYLGEVPGWNHVKFSGDQPVDPYAAEKPILVITAQNMAQYEDKLTEGQKALLKRYPTTYKMNIYPGHRDFRYPDYVCRRAMSNALNAKLVNDGMGVEGLGQVPFPIPKNGMEVLWNHQLPARAWTEEKTSDLASVLPNGSIGWGRAYARNLAMANSPTVEPRTENKLQAMSNNMTLKPTRDNGTLSISHEPYNFATDPRQAWSYSPLGKPRGVIQLIHGFGEHSRRYLHMISRFQAADFVVYADDHIGHGKTAVDSGTLGDPHSKDYHTYLADEKALHDIAVKEYPDIPYMVFGHSWGSMLARAYCALYGEDVAAMMLCGVVCQMKEIGRAHV